MVEFDNVTKIYDNLISAVYDVSFKVNEGEFVFLIGPSGSGKTTIIKMLIRDEVPTQGKIFFSDSDITKISRNKVYKLRREIGVVFQDFKLVPDKTAFENVAFAMEAAGKKNKEIKETVPYVLDIVGLSNRMKAFPRQLSGGEQQRVAIARAIANNPKILIADEPTGNLDPASSWDIVQVLTKINNWGTTVIMSTHGTDIVNSLNKRVIQMEKGRVIRDDNKGQYELIKPEEAIKEEIKAETKSKDKKKTFQVKLGKGDDMPNMPETSTLLSEIEGTQDAAALDSELKPVGKKHSFKKLFGIFQKKDKAAADQSIMEVLNETPTVNEVEDRKGEPMKFDLHHVKAAEPEEKVQTKVEAKESAKEAKAIAEKATPDFSNINIDDMSLPKSVKADLKASGYKTAQDIVNAGPDELAKNLVIDPEEVILVSKEIKKIAEGK